LRVKGKVKGNEGQTVKLSPADPQGINPKILILKLEIIGRGAGPADLDGSYEDKNYDGQYNEVTVVYDTESLTFKIQVVV
jgi:hypothetical protein